METTYGFLATAVVVVHALWVLWVIVGAFITGMGRTLRSLYLASAVLTLGIFLFRGLCPLTDLENYLQARAGGEGYAGGFLHHYADAFVYGELIPVAPEPFFIALLLFAAIGLHRRFFRRLTF